MTITLIMEEGEPGEWDPDMVAALNDISDIHPDGVRNILSLRVTCAWNQDKETFDPAWQFLNAAGEPMPERRRSVNLTGFFGYMPLFWLGALRDASNEFTPRSGHWGRLLRSVRIPPALEAEALKTLAQLMSPMTPHLAEEIWQTLGGEGLIAQAPWPVADEAMLVEDTVTMPIQVNGKRRGEIDVPRDMDTAEVEKLALAHHAVVKALDGAQPKKLIVVPGRIVNVVI